jgi:hypothetical protein
MRARVKANSIISASLDLGDPAGYWSDPQVFDKKGGACRQTVLGYDLKGGDFDGRFHYRVLVGKLNFLEKGSRP